MMGNNNGKEKKGTIVTPETLVFNSMPELAQQVQELIQERTGDETVYAGFIPIQTTEVGNTARCVQGLLVLKKNNPTEA